MKVFNSLSFGFLSAKMFICLSGFIRKGKPNITQSFQVIHDSGSAFPYIGDYVHSYGYKLCLTSSGHMVLAGRVSHYSTPRPFWQWVAGVQGKVACWEADGRVVKVCSIFALCKSIPDQSNSLLQATMRHSVHWGKLQLYCSYTANTTKPIMGHTHKYKYTNKRTYLHV